jgi:hypothetical protein
MFEVTARLGETAAPERVVAGSLKEEDRIGDQPATNGMIGQDGVWNAAQVIARFPERKEGEPVQARSIFLYKARINALLNEKVVEAVLQPGPGPTDLKQSGILQATPLLLTRAMATRPLSILLRTRGRNDLPRTLAAWTTCPSAPDCSTRAFSMSLSEISSSTSSAPESIAVRARSFVISSANSGTPSLYVRT